MITHICVFQILLYTVSDETPCKYEAERDARLSFLILKTHTRGRFESFLFDVTFSLMVSGAIYDFYGVFYNGKLGN